MLLQTGFWAALPASLALASGVNFGALAKAKTEAATPAPLTYMQSEWLNTHNAARGRYGRVPLVWDHALAKDAQGWANHLAKTETFEHSTVKGQGENLWMGTTKAYPASRMVQSWVDEEYYLKSGTFPDISTSGDWTDAGHVTQILWPSTTHVGCAKASSARHDYLVCRYTPPGNWRGEAFDARRK